MELSFAKFLQYKSQKVYGFKSNYTAPTRSSFQLLGSNSQSSNHTKTGAHHFACIRLQSLSHMRISLRALHELVCHQDHLGHHLVPKTIRSLRRLRLSHSTPIPQKIVGLFPACTCHHLSFLSPLRRVSATSSLSSYATSQWLFSSCFHTSLSSVHSMFTRCFFNFNFESFLALNSNLAFRASGDISAPSTPSLFGTQAPSICPFFHTTETRETNPLR